MKLMIQIKVEPEEARKFIRQMEAQGYTTNGDEKHGCSHMYFTIEGQPTIDYSVSIMDDLAYIGIRPK